MGRPIEIVLRKLTSQEKKELKHLSRIRSGASLEAIHAKEILAVADGLSCQAAALQAGMRSRYAVARLVKRFNVDGVEALKVRHGGGRIMYDDQKRERILKEFSRQPDRKKDGTNQWSLKTLQRALRSAEDGLPKVSDETIWRVLHEAGKSWQKDRSWIDTGKVKRRHKNGIVEIVDVDRHAKKN